MLAGAPARATEQHSPAVSRAGDPAGPGRVMPPASATSAATPGWVVPLLVLVAGSFMSALDTSIVNVAISRIQNDFGATTEGVQWVANGYTLTLGVVVPLSSWLSDRFGLSRLYIVSLIGFGAGSALCGLAGSLDMLVAFRIAQAIGGGILPVITLSILYRIVPREKIGTAMGLYGLGVLVAPGIGPSLGGYLVEYVSWRWIFYVNVPIAIVGAIAAVLVLPQFPGGRAGRFDVLGFLTVATGLSALLLALSEGQMWGWGSYKILVLVAVSMLSLALFVVIELEVAEPLMDVRVFRSWAFTNSLLLISVLSIGLFVVLFYIPLLLQEGLGLAPFPAGLVLLPQALVLAVLTPISGRLYERIGPRWLAVIGLLIVAVGTYRMRQLTLDSSPDEITWLLVFRAVGLGLCLIPIFTSGIASLPPADVPQASAFNNLVRQLSSALGVAAFTALLTGHQAQQLSDRAALLPATTPTPQLGAGIPAWLGTYTLDQQTQLQAFIDSVDWLFILVTIISAAGAILAIFLRSGRAPSSGQGPDVAALAG
ncbi:MAG: DHA2 family efflux MFS transporter permease subunit [Pseudonocardiaceae bacterium]